jgi:hypothetical protein
MLGASSERASERPLRAPRVNPKDQESAGGETRTHTRLPSPNFESGKDCGIVRDAAALRSAFMSFFASVCGMVRVCVRPDRTKVVTKAVLQARFGIPSPHPFTVWSVAGSWPESLPRRRSICLASSGVAGSRSSS